MTGRKRWHDAEWGKRFKAALVRRGWSNRDYMERARIPIKKGDARVSRLSKGHGSMKDIIQACELLRLSPPRGLWNEWQSRALGALESLSTELEARFGTQDRAVIESAMAAFAAQMESYAAQRIAEAKSGTQTGPHQLPVLSGKRTS